MVNDGTVDSAPATVSDHGDPVNDPPVANPQSVTTQRDTPVAITLTGSDVDGDALTFRVTSGPSHGALSGTAPNLTYTPAAGYVGPIASPSWPTTGTVDSGAGHGEHQRDTRKPPAHRGPAVRHNRGQDTPVIITLAGS